MNHPAWTVRMVSDLAGLSQVELVFDAACDPPFYAFHGMHDVMFVPPEHAKTYPRLPQLPPRMQRFGMVGSSTPTRSTSGDADSPQPWTLAFTWPVKRSAWATFMTTQDRLQPQRLALLPPLLIPLTYLTRAGDQVLVGQSTASFLRQRDAIKAAENSVIMARFPKAPSTRDDDEQEGDHHTPQQGSPWWSARRWCIIQAVLRVVAESGTLLT